LTTLTFADLKLSKPILNAISEIRLTEPTAIQQQAFPVILSGRDTIGIAQTGTGKTFAYLLPLLKQLTHSTQKHPRILILVPTRELVLQVAGEMQKLCKYLSVRVGGIYGGGNINTQKAMVFAGLDVLVSTPGRVVDLGSIGSVKLNHIQKLVIDEVDEMLDQGFRTQLALITDMLPVRRQNILFSATMNKEIAKLVDTFFTDPIKVEVAPHGKPVEKIIQEAYSVANFNTKANLLRHLLKNDFLQKVLVFMSKITHADRLKSLLADLGPDVGVIHSRRSQPQRFAALEAFRNGDSRVLISTDVAARGIDIADITHVINFDTPEAPADYIHRIGRTGRAGREGHAITFVNKADTEYLKVIEEMMQRKIPLSDLPAEVAVSKELYEDELPQTRMKNYLKKVKVDDSGAFHEKKAKNKKIQLGGPTRRHGLKSRSVNRAVKRNRSKKK
jgi:ATP-dependent RNA helicase RhlE